MHGLAPCRSPSQFSTTDGTTHCVLSRRWFCGQPITIAMLQPLGSAAQGDPMHPAARQSGRLASVDSTFQPPFSCSFSDVGRTSSCAKLVLCGLCTQNGSHCNCRRRGGFVSAEP